jgi:hypothetical protein
MRTESCSGAPSITAPGQSFFDCLSLPGTGVDAPATVDYLGESGEELVIAEFPVRFNEAESEAARNFERALHEIATLSLRAQKGDAEAAEWLARLALHSTAALNRIAKAQPALFADFSPYQHAWPVIKSRREALSASEQTLFLHQIKLGEAAFIELDAATAKWKMDDAGKMAYTLLSDIHWRHGLYNLPHWRTKPCKNAWIAAVQRLPDFSESSALEWWNLARAFILANSPEPQKVPELNALVTSPSKRKSEGRIKVAILEILKARFLSFAPNTGYQT